MAFEIGRAYTRAEIHSAYRGSLRAYLPMLAGDVVCGCFTEEENPEGPEEVLFGNDGECPGIINAARAVFEQGQQGKDIPVFMKSRREKWKYLGRFLCMGMTMEDRLVKERAQKYPQRVRIRGILWFEKVGEGCSGALGFGEDGWRRERNVAVVQS